MKITKKILGNSRRRNSLVGFTLVELLVVISIIALLLSILMPSLKKARDQAKSVVCMSNIRQTQMGLLLYLEDNGQKFFKSATDYDKRWYNLYDEAGYPYTTKNCPASNANKTFTYGYNSGLGHGDWGSLYGVNSANEIKSPRSVITFSETVNGFYWLSLYGQGWKCTVSHELGGRLADSHSGSQNMSYLDGHVDRRKLLSITIEDWFFKKGR